ncbi:MAG: UvrD-helicase domain-containing protein, partial [Muribaculaceae bacterium]
MSDTFTYKQQEVINLNSGYNMVLAGPGCGKTRILAERVAQAYEKEGIDPSEMLCLTFTNRAAREMFNKIKTRLGSDEADLFVGNIHRYCSHFLFDNGVVSAETTVMDEEDTNEVLTSEVLESEIKSLIEYEIVPTRYRELVSLNWNIVNGLLKINMRSSGSTGLITPSNANKIISAVRLKVMDMQHLIYQIKGGHPYDDWYHKELLETLQFQTYYPSLQDFIDYCKKVKHNGSNYQLLSPVENPGGGDHVTRVRLTPWP